MEGTPGVVLVLMTLSFGLSLAVPFRSAFGALSSSGRTGVYGFSVRFYAAGRVSAPLARLTAGVRAVVARSD